MATTQTPNDPCLCDFYELDLNGTPNIAAIVAAGWPWCGAWLKASEGTYYTGGAWFKKYWPLVKSLGGARYGYDWFRGAYAYLRVDEPFKPQAELYLQTIAGAGGWGTGDLLPIIDVESGENPPDASAAQIEEAVSGWVETVENECGRQALLYGHAYLLSRGVTSHMGCKALITADYGSILPSTNYTDIGWPLTDLFGWQYSGGSGTTGPAGYPKTSPAGNCDISAVTIAGGGQNAIAWMRANTPGIAFMGLPPLSQP